MHSHSSDIMTAFILRSGMRDPHRTIAAIHTLHLLKSALLIVLITAANEAISPTKTSHWISHDLSRFARTIFALENLCQDSFGDFWTKITDENAIFRPT